MPKEWQKEFVSWISLRLIRKGYDKGYKGYDKGYLENGNEYFTLTKSCESGLPPMAIYDKWQPAKSIQPIAEHGRFFAAFIGERWCRRVNSGPLLYKKRHGPKPMPKLIIAKRSFD